MDELEDALQREKRTRNEQDKLRKKVENELRMAHENCNTVERSKTELEAGIVRKDKELSALTNKLHEEQSLVAKGAKQVTWDGHAIQYAALSAYCRTVDPGCAPNRVPLLVALFF